MASSTKPPPSSPPNNQISILFVCLGNICRSPMAEAVFGSLITTSTSSKPKPTSSKTTSTSKPTSTSTSSPPNPTTTTEPTFHLDSAGTDAYHSTSQPDPRTLQILNQNNITNYTHQARKITESDFEKFDWVLGMDSENVRDLERVRERVLRKKKRREREVEGEGGKDSEVEGEGGGKIAQLRLFGAFGGMVGEEVGDPYYGGGDGFEIAFEQVERFGRGFLGVLRGGDEVGDV